MTAQGTYAPIPGEQYEDANGDPAVNYRLFTYLAGTSTKVNTYTDIALSSANANPLTLASDARPTVMLTPGVSYKFVLALPGTDDPPASTLWTRDNIQAIPGSAAAADTDVSAVAGENLAALDCCYLSDGSGGTTAGRWYRTDADNTYSSTAALIIGFATAAITTAATGTVRVKGRITGLSGLVAGAVQYISATAGAITATPPTNARSVLQADSTTAGVILTGEPYASATVQGVVSIGAQTIAGIKTLSSAPALSAGMTYASGTNTLNEIFARCTSALTKNNSIAVADITGLAFAVGANETWEADFNLFGVSAAAADWRFALTGPAGATALWFGIMTANDPFSVPGAVTAFGSEAVASSTSGNELILGKLLLRNGGTAGTVQLRMAQGTADVSNTTINIDSYLVARRRV